MELLLEIRPSTRSEYNAISCFPFLPSPTRVNRHSVTTDPPFRGSTVTL